MPPHAVLEFIVTRRNDGHLDVRVVEERHGEIAREVWIEHGDRLFRPPDSLFARVDVTPEGLSATLSTGPYAHPLPYRMRRT